MDDRLRIILLTASSLALLAGIGNAILPGGIGPTHAQGAALSVAASQADAGETDQPATNQSGQAAQAPAGSEEVISTATSENAPSEEERKALLDDVNRPAPLKRTEEVGTEPAPGTESREGDTPLRPNR